MSDWYMQNDELRGKVQELGGKLNRVIALRNNSESVELTQLSVNTEQGYVVAYLESGVWSFAVNMRRVDSVPDSFRKFHNIFKLVESALV